MRTVWLLAGKDVRMLVRSRALLALLAAYPLVIALLLGTMLLSATEAASIALVDEDDTGEVLVIGEKRFGIDRYRRQAEHAGVNIVEMERPEAMDALREGQVNGVLVIPNRFIARLQTALEPAELEFHTGDSTLGNIITQRVRGVIYNVNLQISKALIEYNSEYLSKLVTGGDVEVLGQEYDLYGLQPAQVQLEEVREQIDDESARDELDEIIQFANDASAALHLADDALEASAAPVRLVHDRAEGKSSLLTARAMSFALAVSIAFVAVILVAASLAAERDEHVLGRLVRGIAHGWQLLASKLLLGMMLSIVFSVGLFAVFGVLAPQAWTRLPLLLVAVAVSSLSFATVGTLLATLTRDARTATLVGILLVLPIIPLGLIPGNPTADTLSQLFPFDPSQELFNATLFDQHPWRPFAFGVAHLAAIGIVVGAASRRLLHRLV